MNFYTTINYRKMKALPFIITFLSCLSLYGSTDSTQNRQRKIVTGDSAVIINPKHYSLLNQDTVEYTIKPVCDVMAAILFVNYYPSKTDTLSYVTKAPFSTLWKNSHLPDQDQLHLQFGYILYHVNGDTIVSTPQPHHWIIDRNIRRSKKRYTCKQAKPEEEFHIDGRLDEWGRFASARFPLGGGFKCSWTGADFFLAADVHDPYITSFDRIEVSFDLTRSRTQFLNINHRIISFAPKSRSFSWVVDMSDTGYTQVDSVIIRIDEEMEWRSGLTGSGYTIEARIPFCVLSALQFPNKYLGFDISIVDVNDEKQNEPTVYTWSGAVPSGRHNPNEWGTIVLRQLFLPLKITLAFSLLFVALLVLAMIYLMLYKKQKDLYYEKLEKQELSPRLLDIMHIIECNIEKPDLSPDYIAGTYGSTVAELEKAFKQELNTSCRKIITLLRIKKAKARLIESDDDMEDIALAAGFTDTTTFVNTFKDLAGVTPEDWRRYRMEDAREEDEELEENKEGNN